jgi:aconitate hydratase
MIAAGLVARKARALGLTRKPWVKTSLAPGSQVVSSYLEKSGLQTDLDALGFNLVGYGCTTCIGNSGPLADNISAAIAKNKLVACSVLSGNRNFEGRVSPDAKANYLASPPLCVVYAIAGDITIDVTKDPIGTGKDGKPVYLKDVWPTTAEIKQVVRSTLTPDVFKSRYSDVFKGPEKWQSIQTAKGFTFKWDNTSTYVKNPPYFEGMKKTPEATKDIVGARPLAILGDSITTDHISPAGSIKEDSPAGKYLVGKGIKKSMFNSLGARRGNHEVMMRGTFANIRIKNEMTAGVEGGVTKHQPSGDLLSIYDAAMRYREQNVPLIVVAGKEYGTGSSRDWAAKGPALLGIKAVVVESFERIHRSNLIGMGILPLQFKAGETRASLKLDGSETFDVTGVPSLKPRGQLTLTIHRKDGTKTKTDVTCRIDTEDELRYFQNGGILNYVIRRLL